MSSFFSRAAPLRSLALIGIVTVMVGGCINPSTPVTGDAYADLRSPDGQVRILAATKAGKVRDFAAVPYLIENLRHEEAPTRLYAHIALLQIYYGREQLASYRNRAAIPPRPFGYDHLSTDTREREAAIQRWEQWYETVGKGLAEEQARDRRQAVEKARRPGEASQ